MTNRNTDSAAAVLPQRGWLTALRRHRLLSQVLLVAGGTAGAQALSLAFAPLITRLFSPDAFGLAGSFSALVSVVAPLAALTYPVAMVLPSRDEDARGLARLSIGLAVLLALAAVAALAVLQPLLDRHLDPRLAAMLIWLLPVAMLLAAMQQVMQQWLIRRQRFAVTAKVAMIHALVLNLAKVTGGVLHPVGVTLVLVTAAAGGLNALLLWWEDRRLGDGLVGGDRGAPWRELARRHRDFPLYRAPQVTLNALSQSLPVLLLASFFGTAAAGHYSLAASVLAAPMVLLAKSVNDVFYPHVATAVNRGEPITASLAKTTLVMSAVGLVPFGAMVVLGPWLFAVLFGDPWWQAGEYARWMAVWLYFAFLNKPSVASIASLGLQRGFLIYEVLSVLGRVAALYVGFRVYHSDLVAVVAFSLVGAMLNLALVGVTLVRARRRDQGLIKA